MTLSIATIKTPVLGWPDPAKVWSQVNVCSPATLGTAMGNLARTKQIVGNQMAKFGPTDLVYFDIEPGKWLDPAVRAFAIDILNDWPAAALFPGADFMDIIAADPEAASEVVAAGRGTLIFPAYHQNANIDAHERVWRPRLAAARALGVPLVVALCRVYGGAAKTPAGTSLAGEPVPAADWLRGVAMAREYAADLLVWKWDGDWLARGEDEVRTACAAGDVDLLVAGVCGRSGSP